MRKYILTESERHIAKRYLKKGEKLDGYRTLLDSMPPHGNGTRRLRTD